MKFLIRALCLSFCATPLAAEDLVYDDLSTLELLALPEADIASRGILREKLGDITLSSGAITITDPLVVHRTTPLALKAPIGTYPVYLWKDKNYPTRPALAELRVNACTPQIWQNAPLKGTSLAELKDGEIFGTPVDAGTLSFADAQFYHEFGTSDILPGPEYEAFGERLFDMMFPGTNDIPVDFATSHKGQDIAVFSSGWGDGFYPAFWGMNEVGCPCALVIQMDVFTNGHGADSTAQPNPTPSPMPALTQGRKSLGISQFVRR